MSPPLALVRIHPRPGCRMRGVLQAEALSLPCTLGRAGISRRKREGDGTTPVGSFQMRELYFRADRVPRPVTGLPARPIDPHLGWSDDPADPLYNRAVRLPRHFAHERLWRDDHLYDYLVVLGYNDHPTLRPLGSAIFLHLVREDYAPTEGCVAIGRGAMRRLLPRLGPATRLIVRSPN